LKKTVKKTTDLTKAERSKVVSLFKGSRKTPAMKISEIIRETGLTRNKVRKVLHTEGLRSYSEGSL